MRELSKDECLNIHGAKADDIGLTDVVLMIQNHESKLLFVGTAISLVAGYYGGKVGLAQYGIQGMLGGGALGVVSGAYLFPVVAMLAFKMVEQSYYYFGLVRE